MLSGALDLPLNSKFFASGDTRRIVFTTRRAPKVRVRQFERVAEVVVLPGRMLEPERVLEELRKRGLRRVLLEGGGEVHFAFAKAGVPSVSIAAGTNFVGRPATWGSEQLQDYTDHRYHQPSDEYRADWDLSGAVQLSDLVLKFGLSLANTTAVPTWSDKAEFKRTAAN